MFLLDLESKIQANSNKMDLEYNSSTPLWGEIEEDPVCPTQDVQVFDSILAELKESASKMNGYHNDQFALNKEYPRENPCFGSEEPLPDSFLTSRKRVANIELSPFHDTVKAMVRNSPLKMDEHQIVRPPPTISTHLRDSCVLILTHAGLHEAQERCVDVLADVLQYYVESFCQLMRTFTDAQDLAQPNDFGDVLTKVLQHMRVPDVDALAKFHECLVDQYLRTMKKGGTSGS